MEQTLVILKPSAIHRGLIGKIINRFQEKGLIITGIKLMHQMDAKHFPELSAETTL